MTVMLFCLSVIQRNVFLRDQINCKPVYWYCAFAIKHYLYEISCFIWVTTFLYMAIICFVCAV